MLWVASFSYCYSDITYGVSPNAAAQGLSWSMGTVVPDASQPWVTLEIGGLAYRYRIEKDPTTEGKVHIRNEDPVNGGYIFEETDDWSGSPGGAIQKYFRFPYTDSTRWGDGEIAVEGDGTISDAIVTYNYKLDINDQLMICSISPLLDPACPGFQDALYKYLQSMEQPSIDDPFYDEWVQAQLDREVDLEEEAEIEEKKESEEDLEKELGGQNTLDALAGPDQDGLLVQLAQVQKIESYYKVEIQGGSYDETIKLEDTNIPDNRRALSNLASDAKHREMVRSQYD